MTFRAIHVGDLHFWSYTLDPRLLLGKRLLGLGNLALKRARAFEKARGRELMERVAAFAPQRVLFSGDFSTTSLDAEFAAARRAMEVLDPATVRIVPGNHDRYTRAELRPGRGTCVRFARSFPFHAARDSRENVPAWPWVEHAGEGLWIAGIDPTTSNGMGCFGRLKHSTMDFLRAWRAADGGQVRELWIACHFPAEDLPGILHRDRGEELRGHGPLLEWIESLGVPVFFLHGHHHRRWVLRSRRAENLVYVNAGAPLMRRRDELSADLGFMELVRDGEGSTRLRVHAMDEKGWTAEDVELPSPGAYADLQRGARHADGG